jgi:outer membrane immunogenic protein
MKTFSAALAFAIVSTASSFAADLPMKAAPVPVQAVNWTGFYGGINLGYGLSNDDTARESVLSGAGFPIIGAGRPLYGGSNNFHNPLDGINGGGQVGYNWQRTPNWVFGVEADIQGSDLKGSIGCVLACGTPFVTTTPPNFLANFPVVFSSDAYSQKIDWFGTVRARAGYASGLWMVYVTGGFAYGEVKRSGTTVGSTTFAPNGAIVNQFAGSYNLTSTKTGWTVGGGAESKLGYNSPWSIKAEYLYIDLGSNSDTFNTLFTQGGGGAVVGRVAGVRTDYSLNREHIVRVGVNYSFSTPLVAKY